ncbi:MAG: M56 family metallopeptidase [Eubacteriales bacterium]
MSEVFLKVINMSIAAGWLVAAVVLLRSVFRKMPKFVMCILWGVVALRLICPFTVQSKVSLVPSAETFPSEIILSQDASFRVETGFYELNSRVSEYIAEHYPEDVAADANNAVDTVTVLSAVWLAGIAAMLVYALVSWMKVRRRVREAAFSQDNIWVCDGLQSPFILGIFRPRIYLPSDLGGTAQAHVIAHENAHLRRKDHLWKPIGFLLLAVYWFNPLMWLAYILLCRDIEAACDEKVISEMNTDGRAEYSESLLECSIPRRAVTACPLAFGETGVKGRVKNVLNYKKPAFWVIFVSLVLCAAVAVCFLTDPIAGRLWDIENIEKDMFNGILFVSVAHGGDVKTYTDYTSDDLVERTLKNIKIDKKPMSLSFNEKFTATFALKVYSRKTFRDPVTLNFNTDASQVQFDGSDGQSCIYRIKNPGTVRDMFGKLTKAVPAEDREFETYVMNTPSRVSEGFIDVSPSFTLSKRDKTFTFYFSLISSYIAHGHYELTDDKLVMSTDDGYGFVYTFRVGDGIFFYDEAESNGMMIGTDIEDGAVFYRTDSDNGAFVYTPLDRIQADIDGDGKDECCELTWGPTSGIYSFYFIAFKDDNVLCRDLFTQFSAGGTYNLDGLFFEKGDDGTLYVCSGPYMDDGAKKIVDYRFAVSFENGHVYLTDTENGERLS